MFFPVNNSDFSLVWYYKKKEVLVQLLSSEPKRTAMDYSKEGLRIFVQYHYNKVTIENVNKVCKTFRKGCPCDILASEMDPSCTRDHQISHLKKVYIRFINFKVSLDDFLSISSRYVSKYSQSDCKKSVTKYFSESFC